MADLVGDDVVVSVDLPRVITPPGEDGVLQAGPTSTRDSEPAIMSDFSSDTDPGLEDELCRYQPLQAAVSPRPPIYDQYNGGDDIAVKLSSGAHHALGSFLYEGVSDPGRVLSWNTRCVPGLRSGSGYIIIYVHVTSPVTPVQPLDTDFLSPGGPASMDNLLAGDSSLMDRDQDLPLLLLPLLPLPDHFGLAGYGPGAEFCLSCRTVTAGYWYTWYTYVGRLVLGGAF